MHIHLAEQAKEVEDCLSWCGRRPATWLLDSFDVDDRWCLVHATHVDDRELERIAASGATVGLCPITESNLGDGIFPAAQFLALSRIVRHRIRLERSDRRRARSCAFSNTRNAWRVVPAIVMAHDDGRSTGRIALRVCARGGLSSPGHSERRSPTVGAAADLITLDSNHDALTGPAWRCGPRWLDLRRPISRRSTASGDTAEKSSPAAGICSASRSRHDIARR